MSQDNKLRDSEAFRSLLKSVESSLATYTGKISQESAYDVSLLSKWIKLAKLKLISSNQLLEISNNTNFGKDSNGSTAAHHQTQQTVASDAAQNEIEEQTADSSSESEDEKEDDKHSSAGTEDSMAVMDVLLNDMEASGRPLMSVFNDGFDDGDMAVTDVSLHAPGQEHSISSDCSEPTRSNNAAIMEDWDAMFMHLQRAAIEYSNFSLLEKAVAKFPTNEESLTIKQALLVKVVQWSNIQREQRRLGNLTTVEENRLNYLCKRNYWSWEPTTGTASKNRSPARAHSSSQSRAGVFSEEQNGFASHYQEAAEEKVEVGAQEMSPEDSDSQQGDLSSASTNPGATTTGGKHEKQIDYSTLPPAPAPTVVTPAVAAAAKKVGKKKAAAKKAPATKKGRARLKGGDKEWYEYYDLLTAYGETHGHCNVPMDYEVTTEDGRTLSLGMWLYAQGMVLEDLAQDSPEWYDALSKLFYTGMLSFEVINAASAAASSSTATAPAVSSAAPAVTSTLSVPVSPVSTRAPSPALTPSPVPTPARASAQVPAPARALAVVPPANTVPPKGILKRPKSPSTGTHPMDVDASSSAVTPTSTGFRPAMTFSSEPATVAAMPAASKGMKRKIITSDGEEDDDSVVVLPAVKRFTQSLSENTQIQLLDRSGSPSAHSPHHNNHHHHHHHHRKSSSTVTYVKTEGHSSSSNNTHSHSRQNVADTGTSTSTTTFSLKNKKLFNAGGDSAIPHIPSTLPVEVSLPLPSLGSASRTPGKSILKKPSTPSPQTTAPMSLHATSSPSLLQPVVVPAATTGSQAVAAAGMGVPSPLPHRHHHHVKTKEGLPQHSLLLQGAVPLNPGGLAPKPAADPRIAAQNRNKADHISVGTAVVPSASTELNPAKAPGKFPSPSVSPCPVAAASRSVPAVPAQQVAAHSHIEASSKNNSSSNHGNLISNSNRPPGTPAAAAAPPPGVRVLEGRYVAVLYTKGDPEQLTLDSVHFAIGKQVKDRNSDSKSGNGDGSSAGRRNESVLPDGHVNLALLKPQDPKQLFTSTYAQLDDVMTTPRESLQVENLRFEIDTRVKHPYQLRITADSQRKLQDWHKSLEFVHLNA